jgi:hypothetical protein
LTDCRAPVNDTVAELSRVQHRRVQVTTISVRSVVTECATLWLVENFDEKAIRRTDWYCQQLLRHAQH